MSTFDPRGGKCDVCGLHRSLRDGICHECEQTERDASVMVDENSEEWTPGGYRL
jgi:recombinational DNA repair protein RecR